jgi:hypothetical protein
MRDFKLSKSLTLRVLLAVAAAGALAPITGAGAPAGVPPKASSAKSKPMNMEEPMAGEMKKEGMKKGDVKKAAEKKDRELRKMIETEQPSAGAVTK